METTDLVALITASGALGTAAFGIVDGLKSDRIIGLSGFERMKETLSKLALTLETAYGRDYETLLKAQYRGASSELGATLRQGVRVGLTSGNAVAVAESLGVVNGEELRKAVELLENAEMSLSELAQLDRTEMSDEQRNLSDEIDRARRIIARYEVAADTRIDAGITIGLEDYKSSARRWATAIAIGLGFVSGVTLGSTDSQQLLYYSVLGLFIGVAAVPLAPVAKDVATAIQSTAAAMKRKQA